MVTSMTTRCRKFAYWSLFAGAHGHTYGCHDIWQFLGPDRAPITAAQTPWKAALDLPGAGQMRHARALLESRPFLIRVPDQSLLKLGPRPRDRPHASDSGPGRQLRPDLHSVEKAVHGGPGSALRGAAACVLVRPQAWDLELIGVIPRSGKHEFQPPSRGQGHDWVLVLDDESKGYSQPGRAEP